jgi:hypothetical protein
VAAQGDKVSEVAASGVPWRVAGSYFEACNCEAICPCRTIGGRPGGRSTEGVCQFVLSWHIVDGHAGEVDLSGLDVVMAGYYDDDEADSPWRVALFVDERSDEHQAEWLRRVFVGEAGGGTMANYAGAIGTVSSVRRARITLDHRSGEWSIDVGPYVDVRASREVDSDEPVACGIPGLDHPGREVVADLMRVDEAPLNWETVGRCGFATDFDYRG